MTKIFLTLTLLATIGIAGFFYHKCHAQTTMLDHFSFSVKDFEQSRKFYDETLAILGYQRLRNFDFPEQNVRVAGYGKGGKPSFWIGKAPHEVSNICNFHIAFLAPSVASINDWYAKCLELGGTDNGKPGPRPQYHPGYYGAFIIDPNGWRIEAVLHTYKSS